MTMMSKSVTSGNERKEESRKVMMKIPKPPMVNAKASIHFASRVMRRQRCILGRLKDRLPKIAGGLAIAIGVAAAWFYHRQGLTLSHYDAKAHLVVARRILDSLTPEYSQIGAVWLPLPHLLNMLPVQIDALYRSGASAVALSILSFGLACYAVARLVLQVTGSRLGALLAFALFALDPDILYLQST